MPRGDNAGKPPYQPTEADRNTVRYMSVAGIPQERIAQCVGVDGIDPKTLRVHFRRELDTGKDELIGKAVGKLAEAIDKGEAWSICFLLKCRGGWKETQVTELAGEVGFNASATELLTSRIASIAARNRPDSGDQIT